MNLCPTRKKRYRDKLAAKMALAKLRWQDKEDPHRAPGLPVPVLPQLAPHVTGSQVTTLA